MRSPYHDFFLVSRLEHPFTDYRRFTRASGAVQVADDVLRYLYDTLQWIPTYNPARNESHQGLCWYGATIITHEGAYLAERIFSHWAELFACGPEELVLTGEFTAVVEQVDDEGISWIKEGEYKKLVSDRDSLVTALNTVAFYANQIVRSHGTYYILHLGI